MENTYKLGKKMRNKDIFVEKLRSSGLRPTKQRIIISKLLFDRKNTFHFSIDYLNSLLKKKSQEKISLATIYNTVHAFKRKGYLKEVSQKGNQAFFDTNTNHHHHFFDEDSSQLIDIKNTNFSLKNLPKIPNGKKIKDVEIIIRVANNNQKQKKN